jgi:hypothetical protein
MNQLVSIPSIDHDAEMAAFVSHAQARTHWDLGLALIYAQERSEVRAAEVYYTLLQSEDEWEFVQDPAGTVEGLIPGGLSDEPKASELLLEALRSGQLRSCGFFSADPRPSEMTAIDWLYIDRVTGGRTAYGIGAAGDWTAVLVNRNDLTKLFRPEKRPGTISSETRATSELRRMARLAATGEGPWPVGSEWKNEIAPAQYGISLRAAGRAWAEVASQYPEMSRAGPKAKSTGRL